MPAVIRIKMHSSLYLRDPEETELGKKIISSSIKLIDELGYDKFTFRKLAKKIKSTEASVYRYFINKQQLLAYLVSWYWNWLEYLIEYRTTNIPDARRRLEIATEVLTDSERYDPTIPHIDEAMLHRLVIKESARVYLTNPGQGSKYLGLFQGYENLCARIVEFIKAINPKYPFATPLATTLVASAHKEVFSSEYLPVHKEEKKKNDRAQIMEFLKHLIFTSIDS